MITLKHGDVWGARGSLRTPKIYYIIYGPPLMAATDNDNIQIFYVFLKSIICKIGPNSMLVQIQCKYFDMSSFNMYKPVNLIKLTYFGGF